MRILLRIAIVIYSNKNNYCCHPELFGFPLYHEFSGVWAGVRHGA